MAQLFLDDMPGRQIFIALLVLPTVIAPLIAGAMWRLMLDNRYGPINQIIALALGRAGDTALDGQSVPRLPGDPAGRDLAVDARSCSWSCSRPLSNVDRSLTEAAEIDGAGFWLTFRRITCRRSGR